jgi:hypothetical protein
MTAIRNLLANARQRSHSLADALLTIGVFGGAGLLFSVMLLILDKSING